MRKIAEPEIRQDLPANVRFGRIRKRDSAGIAFNVQSAIGQHTDFRLTASLLSSFKVALGQWMDDRWTDVQLDVGRHFPKILAIEQLTHAIGHELTIFAPVLHRDSGPRRGLYVCHRMVSSIRSA